MSSFTTNAEKSCKAVTVQSKINSQKYGINNSAESFSYDNFAQHFNAMQLSVLRSIPNEPKNDSTFIRTALNGLYKDKINSLKNKSVTGHEQNKSCLTPEKKAILSGLFVER